MASWSARLMVLLSVTDGSSVTTKVEPELRDVTRVWTLTLPNSVTLAVGISSVNARSSSGDGLSWMFLARMDGISSRDVGREADSSEWAWPVCVRRWSSDRWAYRSLSMVKNSRTWVRYSAIRSWFIVVLVETISRRVMFRMVLAASRRASRAAAPQDSAELPSRSLVFMTGMATSRRRARTWVG